MDDSSNMINPRTGKPIDEADLVGLIAQNANQQLQQKKFSAGYRFQQQVWCVDIWAKDRQEAEEKLQALKDTAYIEGEIVDEIPA